jgi:Ferritin-like domain
VTEPTLEHIDRDGALREAAERVGALGRRELLSRAAIGGGVLVAALALPGRLGAAAGSDTAILNYALTLEELQAAFYTEAERNRALGPRAAEAVRVVGAVERAHVRALRDVLGRAAVRRPLFNFKGTTEDEQRFFKTAVAFEDLAVAAYKAQAPRITSPAVLAAAIGIHSVEARHAAWMRRLVGATPAARAFDRELSRPRVTRIVTATGFVQARPRTAAREAPRFQG